MIDQEDIDAILEAVDPKEEVFVNSKNSFICDKCKKDLLSFEKCECEATPKKIAFNTLFSILEESNNYPLTKDQRIDLIENIELLKLYINEL